MREEGNLRRVPDKLKPSLQDKEQEKERLIKEMSINNKGSSKAEVELAHKSSNTDTQPRATFQSQGTGTDRIQMLSQGAGTDRTETQSQGVGTDTPALQQVAMNSPEQTTEVIPMEEWHDEGFRMYNEGQQMAREQVARISAVAQSHLQALEQQRFGEQTLAQNIISQQSQQLEATEKANQEDLERQRKQKKKPAETVLQASTPSKKAPPPTPATSSGLNPAPSLPAPPSQQQVATRPKSRGQSQARQQSQPAQARNRGRSRPPHNTGASSSTAPPEEETIPEEAKPRARSEEARPSRAKDKTYKYDLAKEHGGIPKLNVSHNLTAEKINNMNLEEQRNTAFSVFNTTFAKTKSVLKNDGSGKRTQLKLKDSDIKNFLLYQIS